MALILFDDFFKIRGRMFAYGAYEVFWQFLAFIFITADHAAPDRFSFHNFLFRLRLNIVLIHLRNPLFTSNIFLSEKIISITLHQL